jgi:mannose-1-phosphate guanylyltransferase
MVCLILCGGSGTRLWPLSRKLMPKQFTRLYGEESLFQQTVRRNLPFSDSFCLVSGEDYQFIAEHQISSLIDPSLPVSYILEPVGRNTAPAIALACFGFDRDETVLVVPSDHIVSDTDAYARVIQTAKRGAEKGDLVTFGIHPDHPETGYGYIETAEKTSGEKILNVSSFREKPDLETAKSYCASGRHFWNSGMFMFRAGRYLDELEKHNPSIYSAAKTAFDNAEKTAENNRTAVSIQRVDMSAIPADSIDYAVMEKSDNVSVVPASIGWSDLGSFDSLYETNPKDADRNSVSGNALLLDSTSNMVIGSSRKIVLAGIDNVIVVDTPDALLLCAKGKSQEVKNVVTFLQSGGDKDRELTISPSTVHRPWGTYTVLEEGKGYKIKNITVKPGKRLSLQKHAHRSEHWVVVCGTATVTVGKEQKTVCPNQSTYIPIGEIHRLANDGKINLVIIETQVGEYLGEDDIERLEDDFNR